MDIISGLKLVGLLLGIIAVIGMYIALAAFATSKIANRWGEPVGFSALLAIMFIPFFIGVFFVGAYGGISL